MTNFIEFNATQFVDTETGELFNKADFTLDPATGLPASKEMIDSACEFIANWTPEFQEEVVQKTLKDFGLPDVKTTSILTSLTSLSNEAGQGAGGGPKPKETPNAHQEFFFELMKGAPEPVWLDDVLTGVGRQQTGNTIIPKKQIINLLTALPTISTQRVMNVVNRKRAVMGDKPMSERHAQMLTQTLRNAIDALDYHMR